MPETGEDILIALALEPAFRGRYRQALADAGKRRKLLRHLNHTPPLDHRYTQWFSTFHKALATISVPPGSKVYIVSYAEDIDGKYMTYEEAVESVPFHAWGTIICISPSLAVYYAECGERAAVIEKSSDKQIRRMQLNSKKMHNTHGVTLIEMMALIFLLTVGFVTSVELGKRIGCIGFIIGFPAGITAVIAVFFLLLFVADVAAYLNFNRRGKLEPFSKTLWIPQLNLRGKPANDSSIEYLLSSAQLAFDGVESVILASTRITDESLLRLSRFSRLKALDLSRTKITGSGLCCLGELHELTTLNLWDCKKLDNRHLKNISNHPALEVLAFDFSGLRDEGLLQLENLPRLNQLDMGYCRITDEGLSAIGNLRSLLMLDLRATKVTGAGLRHLYPLHGLKWLNLRETRAADFDEELQRQLGGLNWLNLRGTQADDACLSKLLGLKHLRWLNLKHTRITNEGLIYTGQLLSLEELFLPRQITGTGLSHLCHLKNLKRLNHKFYCISDDEMKYLAEMQNLAQFKMNLKNITDAGVAHLKGCTKLTSLDLYGSKVTDRGMEIISHLSELTSLHLGATAVSGDSISCLKQLSNLQKLTLSCRFTTQQKKQLQDTLPNCDISISLD